MLGFLLLIILALITLGYFWVKRRYQFWENRGVPFVKPDSLIFGTNGDFVKGKLSVAENSLKTYSELAPHKFGGIYLFYSPVLFIRDPELIRCVLIKDFHHFSDRSFSTAHKQDPLTRHLFNLYGDEWKILRQKLSPTFTPGKMKMLYGLMYECAQGLEKILEEEVLAGDTIRVRDLMAR